MVVDLTLVRCLNLFITSVGEKEPLIFINLFVKILLNKH